MYLKIETEEEGWEEGERNRRIEGHLSKNYKNLTITL